MSKKDFQALAVSLRAAKPDEKTARKDVMEMWKECVNSIARVCEADNPRFDHWKFISACYEE